MKTMHGLAVLFCLVSLSGCATLERGPRQQILVWSEPSGAWVETSHCGARKQPDLTTPATIEVSRRATDCTIHVSKEGYEPVSARLERRFLPSEDVAIYAEVATTNEFISSVAFWGTVFLGSLVIDSATGAAYVLEPDEVILHLEPLEDRYELDR